MSLIPGIEPARLYTIAEAAALLPCRIAGRKVHVDTVHRWRRQGRIACVCRRNTPTGKAYAWWVLGAELLRLFAAGGCPARPISAADVKKRRKATAAGLARYGLSYGKESKP